MAVRFGTDGVRGLANSEVTPEVALAIGRATVDVLGVQQVVTGRDTRLSGTMLESAVLAGAASRGASARSLGVVPTPAVAYACRRDDATAGIMVSASHNPFADNGLKVFAPGGRKLSDAQQAEMEQHLDAAVGSAATLPGPTGADLGWVGPVEDPLSDYERSLSEAIGGRSLEGLKLVVDCANGSNHEVAPRVLRRLGASIEVMGDHPDGSNINEGCGSNHPEALASAVVGRGASLGIAFDGDADRLVAVDHTGRIIDGDHLMAMCALDMHDRGELPHDTVVVTVMTNLGFRRAMESHGIEVVETPVGDRHVLEALGRGGYALGGEQSGHIVFARHSTTGDGLLSALMVLDLLARSERSLADLADGAMSRLPQVLVNVPVSSPMPDVAERLAAEVAAAEASMGGSGRVVLRPSGTEPVVRVMVEADTERAAGEVASGLAEAVSAAAGSS
ncbi:MAG: phosphoglucosamine mutase [Microthrixaceae bacterium]|nr:phosphoglucosamine mutase [Microthrixaceae bacterium]